MTHLPLFPHLLLFEKNNGADLKRAADYKGRKGKECESDWQSI